MSDILGWVSFIGIWVAVIAMNDNGDVSRSRSRYVQSSGCWWAAAIILLLAVAASVVVLAVQLAPTVRQILVTLTPQPTPTLVAAEPGANLALRQPLSVSRALPDFPASFAVDGNRRSWWGSGAPPPQWIEVDLEGNYVVSEVQLLPSQSPAGETVHRLLFKGTATDGRFLLMHEFSGPTSDTQWLSYSLPEPVRGVRFVRIETTSSPSWVSWREIQVIAGE